MNHDPKRCIWTRCETGVIVCDDVGEPINEMGKRDDSEDLMDVEGIFVSEELLADELKRHYIGDVNRPYM
jgi:hypothetical protein